MSPIDARFIVAFEVGRVEGDVIVEDEQGKPMLQGPQPTIVDIGGVPDSAADEEDCQ